MIRIICIFILLATTNYVFAQQQNSKTKDQPSGNLTANNTFTYGIIRGENNTWGYDIYSEGQLVIHQPSIPAATGNKGFKNKPDAEKVARLVITKLEKGQMPPTVTKQEMQKLNLIEEIK